MGGLVGCDIGRRELPPLPQPTAEPVQTGSVAPKAAQGGGLFPATIANGLPLSRDDLNRLVGRGLYQDDGQSTFGQPRNYDKAVTPPECQPALHALQNKAVSGVDFSGFQQVQFNTNDTPQHLFIQIAVVYQSPDAANAVFAKVAGAVAGCGGKDVAEDSDTAGQKTTYQVTAETSDPNKTRWDYHQKGGSADDGYVIEVRLQKNLVFEVIGSGPGAGDLTTKVANALAAKAV